MIFCGQWWKCPMQNSVCAHLHTMWWPIVVPLLHCLQLRSILHFFFFRYPLNGRRRVSSSDFFCKPIYLQLKQLFSQKMILWRISFLLTHWLIWFRTCNFRTSTASIYGIGIPCLEYSSIPVRHYFQYYLVFLEQSRCHFGFVRQKIDPVMSLCTL